MVENLCCSARDMKHANAKMNFKDKSNSCKMKIFFLKSDFIFQYKNWMGDKEISK